MRRGCDGAAAQRVAGWGGADWLGSSKAEQSQWAPPWSEPATEPVLTLSVPNRRR